MSLLLLLTSSTEPAGDDFQYVVSARVTPDARHDERPWASLLLQESATRRGPWTTVETFTLDPVDEDPAVPEQRVFTTSLATLPAAWYRAVFVDADEAREVTDPVFAGSAIRPTVQEIANLMPDRTVESTAATAAAEAGTFTTHTTPSLEVVEDLIDMVLDTVDPQVPANAAAKVQRAGRAVVILQVAMLAEATYFSNQGDVVTARLELWQRLLDAHTETLGDAVKVDGVRTYGHRLA